MDESGENRVDTGYIVAYTQAGIGGAGVAHSRYINKGATSAIIFVATAFAVRVIE